jgi:UDP-N-acetylmuramate dehydrogenase
MTLSVISARSLAELTTLGLGGPAEHFVEAATPSDMLSALELAEARRWQVYVLGGGSNLLVADKGVEGLVLRVATRGIEVEDAGTEVLVTVQAGEPFAAFVTWSVNAGFEGLECLAGIPGTTGATPIQNVGAYGQEVADTIEAVEVLDRATGTLQWLPKAACDFSYRNSRFKREVHHFLVLRVQFRLRRGTAPLVRYAELVSALAAVASPSPRDVHDTVLRLRAGKSMLFDPSDPNGRSAGSFFTNPVVSAAQARMVGLRARQLGFVVKPADMPHYAADNGQVKLSAGWLIERAGISRGLRRGQVGVSTAHALCLVHHGGGTTDALLALAEEIGIAVKRVFDVTLEREPVLWG